MTPDWPDAPWYVHLTLESPWALTVGLLAMAAAIFVAGAHRQSRRMQNWAVAPAILAVLLPVLAHYVVTDREQMLAKTRTLVAAFVEPTDFDAAVAVIAPTVHIDQTRSDHSRRDLIDHAQQVMRSFDLKATRHTFMKLTVTQDNERYGRSYIDLLVEIDSKTIPYRMVKVQSILRWVNNDGDWRMNRIEILRVNDREPREAMP